MSNAEHESNNTNKLNYCNYCAWSGTCRLYSILIRIIIRIFCLIIVLAIDLLDGFGKKRSICRNRAVKIGIFSPNKFDSLWIKSPILIDSSLCKFNKLLKIPSRLLRLDKNATHRKPPWSDSTSRIWNAKPSTRRISTSKIYLQFCKVETYI